MPPSIQKEVRFSANQLLPGRTFQFCVLTGRTIIRCFFCLPESGCELFYIKRERKEAVHTVLEVGHVSKCWVSAVDAVRRLLFSCRHSTLGRWRSMKSNFRGGEKSVKIVNKIWNGSAVSWSSVIVLFLLREFHMWHKVEATQERRRTGLFGFFTLKTENVGSCITLESKQNCKTPQTALWDCAHTLGCTPLGHYRSVIFHRRLLSYSYSYFVQHAGKPNRATPHVFCCSNDRKPFGLPASGAH